MCSSAPGPVNITFIRDLMRGRFSQDGECRFHRIDEYVYKRWMQTRDIRHAERWMNPRRL